MNTLRLRLASRSRSKYSEVIPKEMFVIPNPKSITQIKEAYPVGAVECRNNLDIAMMMA